MRAESDSHPDLDQGRKVVCAYCGALAPLGPDHRCGECGAPLKVLEPLAVDCGWCNSSNRRDLTDTCTTCGGPLPALPGGNPGPRPPDAPRTLPRGYLRRLRYTRNPFVMIGMICTIIFCWSIIFPILGIWLWRHGRRVSERKLAALTHGVPTRGRITSVQVDTSQAINEKHPWRIDYVFDLPHGSFEGRATAWDRANAKRSAGDALWVVVTPEDTAQNAIWPPIR